ncbi:MAG: tyrosine-type recombinase/integrase [Lachnospiraceae bacterium]|nr:tyrosine-type recombinase/integrase [Lachnospiraceae bacterium]
MTDYNALLQKADSLSPEDILIIIKNIENERENLKLQEKVGIIDADGARDELNMISQREKMLREMFVLSSHVTAEGEKRAISYHEATPNNPKEYYSTKMPGGKKIKAKTYEGLVEKLFVYYSEGPKEKENVKEKDKRDHSLKAVFKAALKEKEETENPNQLSVIRWRDSFKRFISDEMAKKDIREITDIDLKKYIQDWVNKEHPKQKAFYGFKGILNLIFGYAVKHKIITENPVTLIKNRQYLKSCDTRKPKADEKILSPEEIDILREEVRHRMTCKKWGRYYINGYAMLFAIETGVRAGELCALKWEDIHEKSIHIHAQQLHRLEGGKRIYYYQPSTKNEKGVSMDGRDFPLTRRIAELLKEIRELQDELNIKSEFIFCHEDGEWIKTDSYHTFLRRLCESKGFKVTNNHALRMSLNSNVLLPLEISAADRAAMLGHSVETNLLYYSFEQKDYLDYVSKKLDAQDEKGTNIENKMGDEGTPSGNPDNVIYLEKRRTRKAYI